jgi:hypothetical protein
MKSVITNAKATKPVINVCIDFLYKVIFRYYDNNSVIVRLLGKFATLTQKASANGLLPFQLLFYYRRYIEIRFLNRLQEIQISFLTN